jgi:hypothetical protein
MIGGALNSGQALDDGEGLGEARLCRRGLAIVAAVAEGT